MYFLSYSFAETESLLDTNDKQEIVFKKDKATLHVISKKM